jgi:hypothetical protein
VVKAVGYDIMQELRMEFYSLKETVVDRIAISASDQTFTDDKEPLLSSTDADMEGTGPLSDSL